MIKTIEHIYRNNTMEVRIDKQLTESIAIGNGIMETH